MTERILIVNADDFGRCVAVNSGIVRAHEHGIVTSASLMVRWPAAGQAAEYAQERAALSVGLHLDLGEWVYRAGEWAPAYDVVAMDDAQAVARESRRQLAAFRELVGRCPTHIDSHQHVHRADPVATVARTIAGELGVPLRGEGTVRHHGDFYGRTRDGPLHEAITPTALATLIESLEPGVTELACHPGDGAETDPTYVDERRLEVESLCDPRAREVIDRKGVLLRSFADAGAL